MKPNPVAARLDCPKTGKRGYRSARAARQAHRTAHFRIRVFRCTACGLHHVTSQAKDESA